ncbi:MAG: hypothetical protein ACK58C_08485 [Betaproteobacteria bacterium]
MIPRPNAALLIRVAWLVAMVAVLVSWLAAGSGAPGIAPQTTQSGERHLLALLVLSTLTFPSGLLWAGLLNIVAYMLDALGYRFDLPDAFLVPFAWLGFVAIGYFQWFKLLPWLWRKRRARPAQGSAAWPR